jgi:16S rRNA (guanine966-N2)-methyltransferase
MRIIGGEWGGRRLQAPAAGTRPTSDRVRQALFDLLDARVGHGPVLDLYAGSGALGLEALSRGAPSAIFVEANREARRTLERNVRDLGAGERARVLGVPVARALRLLRVERLRFRRIFADPPYGDPGTPALLETLGAADAEWLEEGGRLVLETRVEDAVADRAGGLRRVRRHRVGETMLHIFARVEEAEEAGAKEEEERRS